MLIFSFAFHYFNTIPPLPFEFSLIFCLSIYLFCAVLYFTTIDSRRKILATKESILVTSPPPHSLPDFGYISFHNIIG